MCLHVFMHLCVHVCVIWCVFVCVRVCVPLKGCDQVFEKVRDLRGHIRSVHQRGASEEEYEQEEEDEAEEAEDQWTDGGHLKNLLLQQGYLECPKKVKVYSKVVGTVCLMHR